MGGPWEDDSLTPYRNQFIRIYHTWPGGGKQDSMPINLRIGLKTVETIHIRRGEKWTDFKRKVDRRVGDDN
jgi:hypothetical protein